MRAVLALLRMLAGIVAADEPRVDGVRHKSITCQGAVANVEAVTILPTADPEEFLILIATDNNYITLLPTMIAALLWRP